MFLFTFLLKGVVVISVVTKSLLTSHGYVTTPYKLFDRDDGLVRLKSDQLYQHAWYAESGIGSAPSSQSLKIRSIRFCSFVASMSAIRCLDTRGHAGNMYDSIIFNGWEKEAWHKLIKKQIRGEQSLWSGVAWSRRPWWSCQAPSRCVYHHSNLSAIRSDHLRIL